MYPKPHPDANYNWELAYEKYRISKGDKPKYQTSVGGPVVIPQDDYLNEQVYNEDVRDTGMITLQQSEINISKVNSDVNYAYLAYGDKALFKAPNGDIVEATVCLPIQKSVNNKGQINIIFARDIEFFEQEKILPANVL